MQQRKPQSNAGNTKEKLTVKQNGKCYWCSGPLFGWYISRGKLRTISVHLDHVIPYSFTLSHYVKQVVACNICNQIKNDKMFDSEEACRMYISDEIKKRMKSKRLIFLELK